ncbi:MAG TPA: S41 family peptidase [Syntrophales bacterium]|jgi:carboxyl-terminal processing protease|nr:S41 family peptidase [Syntrophales bacterium]HRT60966.1 S41 family peptidase [Syntrophales bacterium]
MKMFNKRFYILVCFWLLPVLLVTFGPYGDSRVAAVDTNTYKSLKLFTEVIDIVEKNYVEDVKTQALIQEAINGMIRSLDPHSAFLTPDQYKELQVDTSGQFGGLGIVITLQNDQLTVVSPIEDTPAFKAGIKAGDKILKIDGQPTKGIAITDAVKKMRGPENTKVILSIMRKDFTQPKDFVITRATIKIKSVKQQVFDGNIGYIRLSNFQESTTDELKKALQEINGKAKPLKGLILDVRNNPGGLLEQAVKVSDAFIKSGSIVSTKGRVKTVDATFVARDDGNEPTCPMVVIVNEGTASASEIISGALQDNSRAIILGTKTFGKGSVQTVIPLEDGSAIKLSTAKYFTPKGRSIQAEGIVPDIVVEFVKMPEEEEGPETVIREKDLKGHIKGEKEAARPKETPEKKAEKKEEKKEKDPLVRDNQLKSAVDILKSWEVFSKSGR